jgi:hypothetical protein
MKRVPMEIVKASICIVDKSAKLERRLRDLRATLLASGQWRAVTMLDRAWQEFVTVSTWPATSELEKPKPAETTVPPLRLHSFPALARPSRLKKERA